jgi:hypothetical protein
MFRQHSLGPRVNPQTAMVCPFGPVEVVGDITNGLEVARATIGTSLDAAVRGQGSSKTFCQITLQPFLGHSAIKMIPGQGFVEEPAAQVEIGVNTMCRKSLLPQVKAELIGPTVEATTQAIRSEQGRSKASVAASEHSLEKR